MSSSQARFPIVRQPVSGSVLSFDATEIAYDFYDAPSRSAVLVVPLVYVVSVVLTVLMVPVMPVSELYVELTAVSVVAVVSVVLLMFSSFLQAKPNSVRAATHRKTRIVLFM